MPTESRLARAQDTLREQQVDDVHDEHAGVHEDVGGDGEAHVMLMRGPDDAQDEGDDAGHGEAEQGAGDDELVLSSQVDLEDGHVGDGEAEV